jgi:glycosyltransferase involved in cell wall biosynthesis
MSFVNVTTLHSSPSKMQKPKQASEYYTQVNKGGALFLALARFHFRDLKIRILAGGYNSAMTKFEPFLFSMQNGFLPSSFPENLEVLGHVENMSEVYRDTNALLHPTRVDSYGMTAVEAVFENCLVATTDIPDVV